MDLGFLLKHKPKRIQVGLQHHRYCPPLLNPSSNLRKKMPKTKPNTRYCPPLLLNLKSKFDLMIGGLQPCMYICSSLFEPSCLLRGPTWPFGSWPMQHILNCLLKYWGIRHPTYFFLLGVEACIQFIGINHLVERFDLLNEQFDPHTHRGISSSRCE